MNRTHAKLIAETITNEQLQDMFNNAKEKIKDWTAVSVVNKGLTKGTAWNILTKALDSGIDHNNLGKINMIREFGEYLPTEILIPKKIKAISDKPPVHQDPIF